MSRKPGPDQSSDMPSFQQRAPTPETSGIDNAKRTSVGDNNSTSIKRQKSVKGNNSSGTTRIRQRTAIACRYCRRRKIRCSGFDPNLENSRCTNCVRFNQECLFTPVSAVAAPVRTIPSVVPHLLQQSQQVQDPNQPYALQPQVMQQYIPYGTPVYFYGTPPTQGFQQGQQPLSQPLSQPLMQQLPHVQQQQQQQQQQLPQVQQQQQQQQLPQVEQQQHQHQLPQVQQQQPQPLYPYNQPPSTYHAAPYNYQPAYYSQYYHYGSNIPYMYTRGYPTPPEIIPSQAAIATTGPVSGPIPVISPVPNPTDPRLDGSDLGVEKPLPLVKHEKTSQQLPRNIKSPEVEIQETGRHSSSSSDSETVATTQASKQEPASSSTSNVEPSSTIPEKEKNSVPATPRKRKRKSKVEISDLVE